MYICIVEKSSMTCCRCNVYSPNARLLWPGKDIYGLCKENKNFTENTAIRTIFLVLFGDNVVKIKHKLTGLCSRFGIFFL